jgi:hypothetical protein
MTALTQDNSALLDKLVSDCITFGLHLEEGLEYIKREYGSISKRTYFRRRSKIKSEDTCKHWLSHFTRIGYIQHQKKQMEIIQMMQDDSLKALYTESNRNPRNENLILRLKNDIRETSSLLNGYALGNPILAAHQARLKKKRLDQPDEEERQPISA